MALTVKKAKRLVVGIIGFTVLAVGIVLLVLPGPALVVIPTGLAILAVEFVWARKLLTKVRNGIEHLRNNSNK